MPRNKIPKVKGAKSRIALAARADTEARRMAIKELAWRLYCSDETLRSIAAIVSKEFNLETPITHITIKNMLDEEKAETQCRTKEMAEDWTRRRLAVLSRLIKKWMPVAEAELLTVLRQTREGMFADENAIAEQLGATKEIRMLIEQERRIHGVGLANPNGEDESAKNFNIQSFVFNLFKDCREQGREIEIPGLLLSTGDAELDALTEPKKKP